VGLSDGITLLLLLMLGSGELLILLAMVPVSVFQGLALRDHRPWRVAREGGVLRVSNGKRASEVALSDVRRVRWAFNGNWTESKIVEDALTLYGERGRRLVKIPGCAAGIVELRQLLRERVHEEQVEVAAPAYLD